MEGKGWQSTRLGNFVTLQRGHDLPDPERRPSKVPIPGPFGITGYHDTAKAKGPGVTVGRSGASFGVVSYSPVDYWPLNTALYVIDFHGNDERFAYYLGTLDDKIELNRRMNEMLEAMARAIFKSWFVDFDPVRAKAEGRQPPGMDAETATLFPDPFEDSSLGEIPRGWRVRRVGEFASLSREGLNPSEQPEGGLRSLQHSCL